MTLLAEPTETATGSPAPWRERAIPALWGAAAAALGLLVVVGLVLLVWASDAKSSGSAADAAATGAALWLGFGGASVSVGGAHVSLLPLLFALVPLGFAIASVQRVLASRDADDDGWVADLLARSVLLLVGTWLAGYAAVGLVAVLWAWSAPVSPVAWTCVLPVLGLPLLAAAVALGRAARSDEWLLGPRLDGAALPTWLRRALWPAVKGATLLMGVGAALVLAAVAIGWGRVSHVEAAVGVSGLGAAVLWLVQLAALPNLALWAVSFLAGPGFSVVDGAQVSWSGSRGGLLPLVPVLGALPRPGDFPWFVPIACLVPVACGGLIGHWALGEVARLSALRTKLSVAAAAAMGAALLVGLLDLLGGSSLGSYRLADMGAPAGWLTLALAGELVLGAVLATLWDGWRLRR